MAKLSGKDRWRVRRIQRRKYGAPKPIFKRLSSLPYTEQARKKQARIFCILVEKAAKELLEEDDE